MQQLQPCISTLITDLKRLCLFCSLPFHRKKEVPVSAVRERQRERTRVVVSSDSQAQQGHFVRTPKDLHFYSCCEENPVLQEINRY